LETAFHYVAQAGLKLAILLPPSPKCCDYRSEPPFPAFFTIILLMYVKNDNITLGITYEQDMPTGVYFPCEHHLSCITAIKIEEAENHLYKHIFLFSLILKQKVPIFCLKTPSHS
jgi:hypothetical protein